MFSYNMLLVCCVEYEINMFKLIASIFIKTLIGTVDKTTKCDMICVTDQSVFQPMYIRSLKSDA